MKAIVCLMISTAITVALSENDLCSSDSNKVCKYHETFPMDYPKTVEDIKQGCRKIQLIARCYINYYEKCGGSEELLPWIRKFLRFVEEKCEEDSDAFQAISRNLDCFTPTMESADAECSTLNGIEDVIERVIIQAGDESTHEDLYDEVECLLIAWEIECKSMKMEERCGAELAEVLSDILKNINYSYVHMCNEKLLSEFSSLMETVEHIVSGENSMDKSSDVEDK